MNKNLMTAVRTYVRLETAASEQRELATQSGCCVESATT